MKLTKTMKRALACGLAFSMVVTGVNVNSGTASAKKNPKLSKSKVSVALGSTVTLTVKNTKKKVKWSTSNKKIAKVTKKKKNTATVKGIKKGSAVITAKVGGKKLKCKVKVVGPDISSLTVDKLDGSALVMKLKKKASLNASDVNVVLKSFKEGAYNRKPVVDAISTADQKTYYLYLSESVPNGDFIQVSIGSKKKKMTKIVQNKKALVADKDIEKTLLWEKGSTYVLRLNQFFNNYIGNVSYSLKKGNALPEGMTLVGKRGIVKGIPTAVGNTEFTVIAQDELGRKANVTLTTKVYDDVTLAALDYKEECRVDDYTTDRATVANPDPIVTEKNAYASVTIEPKGGSGKYNFTLAAPDVAGARLSTDRIVDKTTNQISPETASSTTLYIPQSIAAGSHVLTITVTDSADPTRTVTSNVTVDAVTYFNVSGTVRDAFQNILASNEELYIVPKDAVSLREYIPLRTFLKYEKVTSEWYDDTKLVGGNHHKAYNKFDYSTTTDAASDLISYRIYEHYHSAVVGPLPMATAQTVMPTAAAAPTPAPTGYQVPDVAAGTYMTELPAGDYIVKLLAPNNVFYDTGSKLTIGADGQQDITVPVRFANVSATAKYANGNIVDCRRIYFESANKKYEGWDFSITTDYTGSFRASLPVGVYSAYILDEMGQKQYFTQDITVTDSTADVAIGDLMLAISRYTVQGVVSKKNSDGTVTPLKRSALYIYNSKGICQKVYSGIKDSDSIGTYDYDTGSFSLVLPDGNYTIRYNDYDNDYDYDVVRTVGTFAVAGANISGLQLTYDFATEVAGAVAINADGVIGTYTSNGNNDCFAKLTATETGTYQFTTSYMNGKSVRTIVFDETGSWVDRESIKNSDTDMTSTSKFKLTANQTYYILLQSLDSDNMDQRLGSTTMSVTKVQPAYELNASALSEGSSVNVSCGPNDDSDLNYTGYAKITASGAQKYELNCSTSNSAVEDMSIYLLDESGKQIDSDYIWYNSGTFEFEVPKAGTYYIKVRVYADWETTATVKLELKKQSSQPTTTTTPSASESPDPDTSSTPAPTDTASPND